MSKYYKGNSSAIEFPFGLKLIELDIEDVSFAMDQTERHLEVRNTDYGSYDFSVKRRVLVSLGLFLRIYYKGDMLGEQSASQPPSCFRSNGEAVCGLTLCTKRAILRGCKGELRVYFRYLKRGLKYSQELIGQRWLLGYSLGIWKRPEVTDRTILCLRATLMIRQHL
ncbi:hypothetical protein Fot_38720 [Forsythia ovata]|uniref:Uncharacterized protein n=1 Tax=Forsythia ovata TaxID=205694 RepID=A0ABD1S522_9LAMI